MKIIYCTIKPSGGMGGSRTTLRVLDAEAARNWMTVHLLAVRHLGSLPKRPIKGITRCTPGMLVMLNQVAEF